MSSPPKGTLLRIPRNDSPDPDQYVLLHITPTSCSSQLLNLQMHATEGERAFEAKLTQSKIGDLRARSYTGPAEELERILSALLLKTSVSEPHLLPRGVELAASVDKDCVTLTVRQDIGGIKQRIAAIKIPEAEVDIPIFEWAVESCGVLDSTSTQLESLQYRMSLQEQEITKLTNQLKSLVVLKKEHEETLLVKFSELLNSKKSQIRGLNQALDKANSKAAISEHAPEVDIKEETPPPVIAGPSKTRATRAKAAPKTTARKRKLAVPPSDSESEGFVKMDVDPKGKSVSTALVGGGDETEDSEDSEVGGKHGDYLRKNELGQSDRSATDDEDELPPVRRPFEAFTLRAPDKRTPEPEPESETKDGEVEPEPKTAVRGRGSRARARGRGKGKEPVSPASPPPASTRGRGRGRGRMATRSKPPPKEPSPPPPEDEGTGEDTDDDEL